MLTSFQIEKEVFPMKTLLYLNGKKTTRKAMLERIPESTLDRLIKEIGRAHV